MNEVVRAVTKSLSTVGATSTKVAKKKNYDEVRSISYFIPMVPMGSYLKRR